ncbi:helix-turn-helix domain-containing protein [Neobacillus sp. LXY-1]|uniref:helix-turn-helix domain-containing protein n=1 Tax=Neobacillus sp. LXY-1 TaxID=3379133 RepID=UPI003EE2F00C
MNIAKLIGEQIRYLRQQAGLTQAQLAQGIITQAQISNIEKGRVLPLSTTLFEIANKLGVDVNYFYEQAYTVRHDYISEVKFQIRKFIRERNYEEVEKMIVAEEKNPAFKVPHNWQFMLWHLGIVEYYNKGDFKKSLSTLQKALELEVNSNIVNIKLQEIEILNSIAIINNEIKRFTDSINIYQKAFAKLDKLIDVRDPRVEIRLCYGLAKSHYKIGDYKQSIFLCKRGVNLCINNELLYLLGELYYQIAQNYENQHHIIKAASLYTKAKSLFEIENKVLFKKIVEERLIQISKEVNS